MNLFEEIQRQKQLMQINEGVFGMFRKDNKNSNLPNEIPKETPPKEQSYFDVFLNNIQNDNYGLPIMFSVLSHGFTSNNKYGNFNTNYYSFDVRGDNEIMDLIRNRQSFIKTTDYKGKKYRVVGLALNTDNKDVDDLQRQQHWVGGREGYAFAVIEDSPEIIDYIRKKTSENDIDKVLIGEAIKSIKHYFASIRNWENAITMPNI